MKGDKVGSRLPVPHDQEVDDAAAEFPIEAIPQTLRMMAEEVSRVTTAKNVPLAAAAALGTVSAALGAGIEVATGANRTLRGNLFILGIAESGTGKSENFRFMAKPLTEVQKAATERFRDVAEGEIETKLAIAEERRKAALRKASRCDDHNERALYTQAATEEDARKRELERMKEAVPTYVVGDITREALAVLMGHQNREAIASFSAEARGIVSVVSGRYSNASDEDIYCAGYSGDGLSVHRASRGPVNLERPCLTVCWFVQPDIAAEVQANTALTQSGMLPRFLVFNSSAEPTEEVGHIEPIPGHVLNGWNAFVSQIVETFRDSDPESAPVVINPSPEASAVLIGYSNEAVRVRCNGGGHRDLASYVARWGENAWRLALVFHVARHGSVAGEHELSEETAKGAVTVMRWFNEQQLKVLRESRHDRMRKRYERLRGVIEDRGGECSMRDLQKNHTFDPEEVEQLAEHFAGITIKQRKPPGGGRPSVVVSLRNPKDDEAQR